MVPSHCHNLEDYNMDLHHHENLKSDTENYVYGFQLLIVTQT
jgi:hypothetical protein